MKNNKIVHLFMLGTLISTTLLSSYQSFAEESLSTTNQALSSPANHQSTEHLDSGGTESSENPVPNPEPVEQYRLFANGEPIVDNTYRDANGSQITFQYDSNDGLIADIAVHYTVKTAPGYKLKEVRIIDTTKKTPILTSAAINDVFMMPESDVSIQLETMKEEPSKTDTKSEERQNTSNNNVPKEQVTHHSAQKPTVNVPAANNEQQLPPRQPEGESSTDVRIPSNQATPAFSNDVQTAIV